MEKWLANYAYHIDLQVRTFLLVGLMALGLAIITISAQAVRAALMQPVKSLKEE